MKLKLIPDDTNIAFTKGRLIAFIFSAVLLAASVALVAINGLNLGVDFKGGVTVEVSHTNPINIQSVREAVGGLGLGEPQVQEIDSLDGTRSGVVVTVQQQDEEMAADLLTDTDTAVQATDDKAESVQFAALGRVKAALQTLLGDGVAFEREEVVGPTVSGELIRAGITAVILAIGMMLIYIWLRFEWQFSVGAILALAHDVTLTLGVFALTRIEFNLPIIAALLTIVGYSMNDTVVVYDRVRENLRKYKKKPLAELLDLSINETLTRTVMTSVTTLLALIALYVLGGEVLRGFTFAMIWGVVVGTYSSIFVASPLLLLLGVKRDWSKAPAEGSAPATA
ncbi:MAG: protein translocase subunit SecF [Pseudomonadota bacterium]